MSKAMGHIAINGNWPGTSSQRHRFDHGVLVVVFDREKRLETCDQIKSALIQALCSEGISSRIVIGIPDRDIESWIVADPEMLRSSAKIARDTQISCCEGRKGKSVIKSLLGHGQYYVETVHGQLWLKKSRASVIASNSASFAAFATELSDLDCWWLQTSTLL
jgi:Domain of unknown function (DUF4276)